MGDKFVFAQVIRDVIEFLELDDDPTPELTPEVLAERFTKILKIAVIPLQQSRMIHSITNFQIDPDPGKSYFIMSFKYQRLSWILRR